jgi:retinol dehydrogenase-12
MASVLEFFKEQFSHVPYPTKSFEGQTIIVTGSNIGLGLEAARHFARLNAAKVILACRSISKGQEAARSIAATVNRDVCEAWELDLADFESVKAFAKKAESLDRLDIVCENAGVSLLNYSESAGTETTIAVNVIGTFLLTLLLLPILRTSAKRTGVTPRLVVTASEVHQWVSSFIFSMFL